MMGDWGRIIERERDEQREISESGSRWRVRERERERDRGHTYREIRQCKIVNKKSER